VEEYFDNEPDSTVKDVFLCDVDRKHVDTFTKALKKRFGERNVTDVNNSADDQQWSLARTTRQPFLMRDMSQDSTGLLYSVHKIIFEKGLM